MKTKKSYEETRDEILKLLRKNPGSARELAEAIDALPYIKHKATMDLKKEGRIVITGWTQTDKDRYRMPVFRLAKPEELAAQKKQEVPERPTTKAFLRELILIGRKPTPWDGIKFLRS